jgi:FkbH-like protein
MTSAKKSCLLIADFTLDPLPQLLRRETESTVGNVVVAPFDQVNHLLRDPSHAAWREKPEMVVVWTRPEAAVPAFGRLCQGEFLAAPEIAAEVARFATQLGALAGRVETILLPCWTLPPTRRGLGLLDLRLPQGQAANLLQMNVQLAAALAAHMNIFTLNAERWLALAAPSARDGKLWYLGKMAFGAEVMKAAADMAAALRALSTAPRKLLVLDLDDTLWGGLVGEVGWQGLELGGHSPLGESFQAFQMALKALTRRGVVLAIVSKNTEAIALEAIDSHAEMRLRRDDFAGWRINWQDKAANIADLVQELNLGLDAVVFIDDSPAERARVREALPDVIVPEWPEDKMQYVACLGALTCFDTPTLTAEDASRAGMYAAERKRRDSRQEVSDLGEWLESLGIKIHAEPLGGNNLKRAAQLLNKTNQFNLSARRMKEAALQKWAVAPENQVIVFTVADRFSAYGLTGIVSLELKGGDAHIVDLILSCRVFGRGVERTMLAIAVGWTRERGAGHLRARYQPSARNEPTRAFLANESSWHHSGTEAGEPAEFTRDLSQNYDAPPYVSVGGDR